MNSGEKSAIEFFSPRDRPYGIGFGEWTVRWWKWLLSCPTWNNPALDLIGKYSHINQSGPVWFLAGTMGEKVVAYRNCVIPASKSILFPVINYEINRFEKPELRSEKDMIFDVAEDQDDIINLMATIGSKAVPIHRVQSEPNAFPVYFRSDNCLGIPPGTKVIASDGYWVFLKPLPLGYYKIFFHGSCSGGIRSSTANYEVVVK